MVYKKYIKRGGKIYGPYQYHSHKINGKVITEYIGKTEDKNNKTLIFLIIGIIAFLSLFFILNYNINSTWAIDLTNSVSSIINSSLTSIKTITGFVISFFYIKF